jgi:hypothetical protein
MAAVLTPALITRGVTSVPVEVVLSWEGTTRAAKVDSYTCTSPHTYLTLNGAPLADVNECSTSNGGCAHNCTNLEGSFSCSCRDGFFLGEDNRVCLDSDECLDNECSQICVNLIGGFRCECGDGYTLEGDGSSCSG